MYKIICICGSTEYKDLILERAKALTLSGNIVLLPLVFSKSGDVITKDDEPRLIELHRAKMKLANELYFITMNGEMSPNVQNEFDLNLCILNKPYTIYDGGTNKCPN